MANCHYTSAAETFTMFVYPEVTKPSSSRMLTVVLSKQKWTQVDVSIEPLEKEVWAERCLKKTHFDTDDIQLVSAECSFQSKHQTSCVSASSQTDLTHHLFFSSYLQARANYVIMLSDSHIRKLPCVFM